MKGTEQEVVGEMERAMENTEPLDDLASGLVDAAVSSTARESGRTVEEQWERMGDGYAYQAMEQHPRQKQLDDYGIEGDWQEVPQ